MKDEDKYQMVENEQMNENANYLIDLREYSNQEIDINVGGNRVIGYIPEWNEKQQAVTVSFWGTNNILYLGGDANSTYEKADITFKGNGGIVYLSENRHRYHFSATIEDNGICWFGRDVFMNRGASGVLKIHVHSGHAVALGYDCLLSTGISIDTAAEDGVSGDILIGNHVWIGQNVMIQGPSQIDGNAILGAEMRIKDQHITSNSIWITKDGVPKRIKENTVFTKDVISRRKKEELKRYKKIHPDYMDEILTLSSWDAFDMIADAKDAATVEDKLSVFIHETESRQYVRPKYRAGVKNVPEVRDFSGLNNVVYGDYEKLFEEAKLVFQGKGNVLILEKGVNLGKSRIRFSGDDALVFIRKNNGTINATFDVGSSANLYLGKRSSFSKDVRAVLQATENKTLFIGNDCQIGSGVFFRTSDQHPIYDIESRKRMNRGKSIFIGDRETIEPWKVVLKGTKTGEMKGPFRRKDFYKRAFKELSNETDMKERIKWMVKLEHSEGISRVLNRLGMSRNILENKHIIEE